MKPVLELPKELQQKYRLKNWPGNGKRQHFGKFGLVDLEKISESQAARLVRMKFPWIESIESSSPEKAKK